MAFDGESGGLNYNESLMDIENRRAHAEGIKDPINEEDENMDGTND